MFSCVLLVHDICWVLRDFCRTSRWTSYGPCASHGASVSAQCVVLDDDADVGTSSLLFPPIDIQHPQCLGRGLIPERDELRGHTLRNMHRKHSKGARPCNECQRY